MTMKKKPLALRFVALYLLLGVVPLIVTSVIFLHTAASLSTEDAKELYSAELRQIAYYSENHLRDVESSILRYVTNERLISYLSPSRRYAAPADSVDAYLTFLRPLITTEFLSGSARRHLKIYYLNPHLIQGYNVFVYADEKVQAKEEYRRAVGATTSNTAWYFDPETRTLHSSQAIRDSSGNIYGVFSVSESVQVLNELYRGLNTDTADLFLMDEMGTVIASNHPELVGASSPQVLMIDPPEKGDYMQQNVFDSLRFAQQEESETVLRGNESMLLMRYQLRSHFPDWQIVLCIPNGKLRSNHDAIVMIALYASLGLSLLSSIIMLFITNHQIGRFKPLLTAMRADAPLTALDYQVPERQDELDEIMIAYNSLIHRIIQLIQENYLMQLAQKEAELHALQTQINPHFIYNLLEQIHMRLILAGDNTSARMVLLFSRLIRRAIKQKEELVPLREEIEFVQYYLELQKMRYNNRITYEIEVPDELMSYYIPRFTLEPLIENSFKHGFSSLSDSGVVMLKAEQHEHDFEITIWDTSSVPTVESAAHVMEQLNDESDNWSKCIGIYNVDARLRMRYGSEYGVRHIAPSDQEKGCGWLIVIRLPALETATIGGENNDLHSDR